MRLIQFYFSIILPAVYVEKIYTCLYSGSVSKAIHPPAKAGPVS